MLTEAADWITDQQNVCTNIIHKRYLVPVIHPTKFYLLTLGVILACGNIG